MLTISGPPSPPRGPIIIEDIWSNWVKFSWKPSECDGGFRLNGYRIEKTTIRDQSEEWKYCTTVHHYTTSWIEYDLQKATKYKFRIFARNSRGLSDALESDEVETDRSKFGNIVPQLPSTLLHEPRTIYSRQQNIILESSPGTVAASHMP